jgi:hypothetical protein
LWLNYLWKLVSAYDFRFSSLIRAVNSTPTDHIFLFTYAMWIRATVTKCYAQAGLKLIY